eukprot:SAG31_NODE_1964_length_6799_cov_2.549552_6_plen_82_part_00
MQTLIKVAVLVGVTFAEIEKAPLSLKEIRLPKPGREQFVTSGELVGDLLSHITEQAIYCKGCYFLVFVPTIREIRDFYREM